MQYRVRYLNIFQLVNLLYHDASLPYITKYPNSLIIDERLSIEINALSLKRYVDALSSTSVEDLQSIFFENTPEATVDRILACKNGE